MEASDLWLHNKSINRIQRKTARDSKNILWHRQHNDLVQDCSFESPLSVWSRDELELGDTERYFCWPVPQGCEGMCATITSHVSTIFISVSCSQFKLSHHPIRESLPVIYVLWWSNTTTCSLQAITYNHPWKAGLQTAVTSWIFDNFV